MFRSIALLSVILCTFLLPIHDAQAAPKFTRSSAYGDWILNCTKDDDPKKKAPERCGLSQKLMNERGNVFLAVNILNVDKAGNKAMLFTIPLGFYLPAGVTATVDNRKARNLLVVFCTQEGCAARLPLDAKLTYELSRGKKMMIRLKSGDQAQNIQMGVSLKGITAGLKAVK